MNSLAPLPYKFQAAIPYTYIRKNSPDQRARNFDCTSIPTHDKPNSLAPKKHEKPTATGAQNLAQNNHELNPPSP
ncbi:hypothetical protein KC19_VG061100 [Ceratodon purpureus]|uniref:Uncharacterized protein n=1 Tax=Ceratodon purpureus TaxID=3225 RepID=A0A8T0HMF7_CERPU|nr:hypothetical protein KC19_VG061100 [Ceratodon purpureus]